MKLFYKRNIAAGMIALAVGVFAVFGIAKIFGIANMFGHSTETVTGNISAFILNPEGKVDGAILDTGDQVHFGAETAALVARQIKVGDALTVAGRSGYKSDYGREFHAETLQFNNQTITVVRSKPMPPHGDKGPKGKKPLPPGERPNALQTNIENPVGESIPPPPVPRETMTANGNVRFVLVGRGGEARGLILSDGTQVALPKEVKDSNLTFNEQTSVNVEGEAAKSDFGAFIKPTKLTIGDQTFSFNR